MKRAALVAILCLGLGTVAVLGDGATSSSRGVREVLASGKTVHSPPVSGPTVATVTPAPTPPPRSFATLESEIGQLLQAVGATGGVSLIELGGGQPQSWSLNGDESFSAASTYKLPLLMKDAEDFAAGRVKADQQLCYETGDWEDGWYTDYEEGMCYTRAELDYRVGIYSDNTAAHILVRYGGGADALNAYARSHGATESAFYDPNTTTAGDLARLWQSEADGKAGGVAAQSYLFALLTRTHYEEGIPAGVPSGEMVAHKVGFLDAEFNDAALVEGGPRGAYVLSVCTEGGSWQLIAQVAHAVAVFEAS